MKELEEIEVLNEDLKHLYGEVAKINKTLVKIKAELNENFSKLTINEGVSKK